MAELLQLSFNDADEVQKSITPWNPLDALNTVDACLCEQMSAWHRTWPVLTINGSC